MMARDQELLPDAGHRLRGVSKTCQTRHEVQAKQKMLYKFCAVSADSAHGDGTATRNRVDGR
jgi:hypothetical protein